MRNRDALNRLRNSIAVASFGEPSPQPLPPPTDVYRETQLLPRTRQELEDDANSNFLQFVTTTHFLTVVDGSRQVLAQNKRRQFLSVQVITLDAIVFVNFGNEASAISGIAVGTGYTQTLSYDQKVPNNSLHLFTGSETAIQIIVTEGSPEP